MSEKMGKNLDDGIDIIEQSQHCLLIRDGERWACISVDRERGQVVSLSGRWFANRCDAGMRYVAIFTTEKIAKQKFYHAVNNSSDKVFQCVECLTKYIGWNNKLCVSCFCKKEREEKMNEKLLNY